MIQPLLSPVRITAVGDLLLGDTPASVGLGFASRHPGEDASTAFDGVREVLKDCDILFGNLECPLGGRRLAAPSWRQDQLRGDPDYAEVLARAGFSVLSVANNHAAGHGLETFEETLGLLHAAGIRTVGRRGQDPWCCEPLSLAVPGTNVMLGFLAYSWRPAQGPFTPEAIAGGTVHQAEADVRRLRPLVDAVVVSLHWGEDFVDTPSTREVAAARRLCVAGAGLVIGHHPQVLRPIETLNGSVVAYSLGSLVADHVWYDPMRSGGILQVEMDPQGARVTGSSVTRLSNRFHPELVPGAALPITSVPVTGLSEVEYLHEAVRRAREQRWASYRYTLRRLNRYAPSVLMDMVASTARNKLRGIARRLGRGNR